MIKASYLKTFLPPLMGILVLLGLYLFTSYFSWFFNYKLIVDSVLQIASIICIYWLLINILNFIVDKTKNYLKNKYSGISIIIADFIKSALKAIILLSLISFITDFLPLPRQYIYLADKITSILIILLITWILIRIVNLFEKLISIKYNIAEESNFLAQKAHTQIIILKRILISIIVVVAFGAILLLFENVRQLGTSILTTAGIAGIVAGLTLQKPLNGLVMGLQIALHQPIKINDLLIIENEFGQIEEINLYYVVIRIWDLRRYIIPINYFLEKPFQNLSRSSTESLATVFLYVDYTLPVEPLRKELKRIAEESPLWTKKVCALDVSDSKEFTMELRILVSTRNPMEAWGLRCEIREKLIYFIQKNYPHCLSRKRVDLVQKSD